MSEPHESMSFIRLIRECDWVEIPRIQRDYAQGRDSAESVRTAFLTALDDALSLPADDPKVPLNLDFVYGSMVSKEERVAFHPLDGQQRLTTLCLLHWYAAWVDGAGEEFRAEMLSAGRSRFAYDVRPSSSQFFDALMAHAPDVPASTVQSVKKDAEKGGAMRQYLENQPWFFLYWRLDPTIHSALRMLDAIHEKFAARPGLYARMVDATRPAITFQLLKLESFGLSDDLYVKMNARGKPLTRFEQFKASMEDYLRSRHADVQRELNGETLPLADYFAKQMDSQWTNFLWASCVPKKSGKSFDKIVFDPEALNFFWVLARACRNPNDVKFITDTDLLRNKDSAVDFDLFKRQQWLTLFFVQRSICLLNQWGSQHGALCPALPDNRYFDEAEFFKDAVRAPAAVPAPQVVLFGALVRYLHKHEGSIINAEINDWMRVMRNLTLNSDCSTAVEFHNCTRGCVALQNGASIILDHLAGMKVSTIGFKAIQVVEEILKAKLILAHPEWRKRIEAAEDHGYFCGQIEFLLNFCGAREAATKAAPGTWPTKQHEELQASFDEYFTKAALMFNKDGLVITPDYRWERALLATGDYLMPRGGKNHSFLTNPRQHPDSWQRYLQHGNRVHLKKLWDSLDASLDLMEQLQAIIDQGMALEDWRVEFLRQPGCLDYCGMNEVQFDGQEVYLLKKQQMNGDHAELYSYALHLDLRDAPMAPLHQRSYRSVQDTSDEPTVCFHFTLGTRQIDLGICSWYGKFHFSISDSDIADLTDFTAALTDGLQFTKKENEWFVLCPRKEAVPKLKEIAQVVTDLSARGGQPA
jgi:Protein of unknown function DUF262